MSTDIDGLVNALQEEVQKLTAALQEKEQALKEAQDRSLRALADLQNFQRRTAEDQKQFRDYAAAEMAKRLLPVLDHFDQALKSLDQHEGTPRQLAQGFVMIAKELSSALEKEGIKRQTVMGQVFDPLRHEVVSTVEVEKGEDGRVVEELRPGYDLKDKVLRPAMVKVQSVKKAEKTNKEGGEAKADDV